MTTPSVRLTKTYPYVFVFWYAGRSRKSGLKRPSLHHWQFVTLPARPGQQTVCFFVADKALSFRIPCEFPAKPPSNVRQMAHGHGPVPDLHRSEERRVGKECR